MGSIELKSVRKSFGAFDIINGIDLTINDSATANRVGDAFRAYFGADRVTELTDPLLFKAWNRNNPGDEADLAEKAG